MKMRSKARAGKSPRKAHKAAKASRRKVRKPHMRTASGAGKAKPRPVKTQRQQVQPVQIAAQAHRASEDVPTLEQVTITCANCGRPFKLFKLKGLSLDGTICQRCSLGEMELPESFG